MKAITLNLATRPFRNNALVASVLAGIAASLVMATVYNLYFFLHYGSSYAALRSAEVADRAKLETIEAEERSLSQQIQGRDFRRLYERGRFANDLILKRSFSWTLLFNKLEAVVPPDVMMTAIHPNITTDAIVVRVDGMAKNSGGFIALQEKLLENPAFSKVYPVSERKINPNRPDISFALNFGYLPKAAPPAPMVASAAPASAVAPGRTAPEGTAAAPQGSAAGAAPAPPAPDGAVVAPPPTTTAAAPAPAAQPAKGTVGRDGQPRTTALLAKMVAAPGGIYPLPAAPPPKETPQAKTQRTKGKDKGPPKTAVTPGPAAAQPASPPPAPGSTPGRAAAVPIRRELGLPPWLDPGAAARARTADPPRPPVPAVRLDVPLKFTSSPAREIYDALAKAHAVRFVVQAGVDVSVRVTADLSGRSLAEAIGIVARAAGHRVTRGGDGVYRVATASGGEPIADKPIREETLAPAGGKP